MTDQELVEALGDVWRSMAELGGELTEDEWQRPTDCPGWSVHDVMAHIVGIEEMSMGRPAPEVEVPDYEHVGDGIGRINEVWVESMRPLSGAEMLERFTRVTGERLAGLRALDESGFGADSWTPSGPGTVRDLLPFRIFDSWVHEQDIRLALGRPGSFDSTGAAVTFQRCVDAMGYVVAKRAGLPEGATVRFDLAEPLAGRFAVGVRDGRGGLLDEVPDDPTVTVSATGEAFVRVGVGRTTAEDAGVAATGDPDLAERVLANLHFLRF